MIELAVFDVAGTTVNEQGTVYRVLADTVRDRGADPTPSQIQAWMGAGKREAIQALLVEAAVDASGAIVDAAFADFRVRLAAAYRADQPVPFQGVTDVIVGLRASGIKVALTTGFDREVMTALLTVIGWDTGVLDAVVCIDDVPAGRPKPYMIFRAMEATGIADVRAVLTAGDTVRDVEAGLNAGAGAVLAVRTGEVDGKTLAAAGPTEVLSGVIDIPEFLARRGQPVHVGVRVEPQGR